jgi:hypothetical protein
MKIIQSILTKNDCYLAGRKITVKGLMLHSVGCPQPSAEVFIRQWNQSGVEKCVHGFIDGNTGDVHQCLPWNFRGWHGGGSSNNTHIGVEMCEPSTIKYTGGASYNDLDPVKTKEVILRTYNSAVELFAFLCKEYKLDPLKDIVSHAEGHKRGIASNHGDPDHLWKKFGLTMDKFRLDVKAKMGEDDMTKEDVIKIIEEYEAAKAKLAVSEWAKPSWNKAKTRGAMDGTMPKSHLTREQFAAVLDRLGLL